MAEIYLSLGSNQGDRLLALVKATQFVDQGIGKVQLNSYVVESEPWGFISDTPFYNLVLKVQTELLPVQVLDRILDIETRMGRIRSGKTYGNRIIDIDILFYNNEVIGMENLEIPHPFMHKRRFVLQPLATIAPGLVHPVLQQTIIELLNKLDDPGNLTIKVDENKFSELIYTTNL
jgi:2-amino-4-hydroxy-6-hydroxymethyldihydropteridine diphosphokinase